MANLKLCHRIAKLSSENRYVCTTKLWPITSTKNEGIKLFPSTRTSFLVGNFAQQMAHSPFPHIGLIILNLPFSEEMHGIFHNGTGFHTLAGTHAETPRSTEYVTISRSVSFLLPHTHTHIVFPEVGNGGNFFVDFHYLSDPVPVGGASFQPRSLEDGAPEM